MKNDKIFSLPKCTVIYERSLCTNVHKLKTLNVHKLKNMPTLKQLPVVDIRVSKVLDNGVLEQISQQTTTILRRYRFLIFNVLIL